MLEDSLEFQYFLLAPNALHWSALWVLVAASISVNYAAEAWSCFEHFHLSFLQDLANIALLDIEECEPLLRSRPYVRRPIDTIIGAKLVQTLVNRIEYGRTVNALILSVLVLGVWEILWAKSLEYLVANNFLNPIDHPIFILFHWKLFLVALHHQQSLIDAVSIGHIHHPQELILIVF